MFGKMAKFSYNFCKNTNGSVAGSPRIQNLSKVVSGSPTDIVGYTQVNTQATNAFNRTKIHKGYFYCQPTDISDGDLILDRFTNDKFFVMSVKAVSGANETVYMDGTLYWCDSTITVSRFGTEAGKDTFGRTIIDTAKVVSQPVGVGLPISAMTIPKNFDILEQQDRQIPQDKLSLCVQSTVDVRVADRIIDDDGEVYRVVSISKKAIRGLWLLYVDVDVR